MKETVFKLFEDHLEVIQVVKETLISQIVQASEWIKEALMSRNTIFLMGNGGSAADAQHIAAELVGRFKKERRCLPAIALTTDTSILTAVGNDYGFENIFSRQIEGLVNKGDIVIGISTSGNSHNILNGIETAKKLGAMTVGLTGKDGGRLKNICDLCLVVPSTDTARVQEAHITIGHIVCELVEEAIVSE